MPSNEDFTIQLNGEKVDFKQSTTIQMAINYLMPNSPFVAAELNEEIIDRSKFDQITLKNGDILEIIQPLGGGCR